MKNIYYLTYYTDKNRYDFTIGCKSINTSSMKLETVDFGILYNGKGVLLTHGNRSSSWKYFDLRSKKEIKQIRTYVKKRLKWLR